ncbi:hypothetical protein M427DRAFT_50389 [Gonapodya prolifera JEL478]|uniref:Transcription factor domain-containing protein n=1 Tax=Gonapodya prolifera (strain JEL478) TaxID=1344416 RepID=A0A139AZ70_GONPJ|nr:hypothetical protein M427DRAFT_50389 [Gonapodya prolifera JEL478]|eukprot:KXS22026.1 hypothetical protein M427DRAFT_50389 [Gonapodya prolifera JEL478]
MSVLPREVTIFDGLPPAPSSTTMNNLITRYFVRKPELMLIHRSTFLSSPAQNPILAYSALAFAGASHEDPEVRNAARRVFYPRLQRLIRAEWESPSLETVIGMMHAEMLASHWKLWDQAYYLRARVAFSVTYLRLHSDDFDPRILNSPMGAYDPWILQETARRVYWMAMTMDGTVVSRAFHNASDSRMIDNESVWPMLMVGMS